MSDKKLVKSAGGVLGFVGGGVLSLIPEINIIGYVLVLIAMRGLSRAYNNDVIWRNAVPAVAMSITGMIIANFAYVKAMTVAILGPLATNSWEATATWMLAAIAAAWWFIMAMYIVFLIGGLYWLRTYGELVTVSGIQYFARSSKLYWLGSALLIIGVGAILVLIAGGVYAILGFRRLSRQYDIKS
ncbi:DUF996 domain-containing protein [Vulcanisaeta souniana]|uniref:DUF996 domain-containing protein n=1 Tax=Vulcanisaeta souniana TaxID=164452 RepID=UPI0006D20A27|nr:DUF996 domain-containing protein [Vulcanisaeta souniana]